MSKGLQDLQDKRGNLAKTIQEFADKNSEGNWDAETQVHWEQLNNDYDAVMSDIEAVQAAEEQQSKVTNRLEEIANHGRRNGNRFLNQTLPNRAAMMLPGDRFDGNLKGFEPDQIKSMALAGWFQNQMEDCDVNPLYREAADSIGFQLNRKTLNINLGNTQSINNVKDAFHNFPRPEQARQRELAALENYGFRNALTTSADDGGDHLFSESFTSSLEVAMLAYGGILQVADIIRTSSGETYRWPTANDTGNTGRQVGEAAPVAEQKPDLAERTWGAFKYTSDEILVSQELLEDDATNLISILPEMLGERLGRIQNTRGTTGTGSGQATGIITDAAQGVTKSGGAITFDEIISLEHSVDPAYRTMAGAGYMLHDTILKTIRQLKDGNNNYLWQSGANAGSPDTLNRYPYTINQDMDSALTAGQKPLLFGSLRHFKVRQVRGVRLYRLVERHRENDMDAFLGFVRSDSKMLFADSSNKPIKYLEMT